MQAPETHSLSLSLAADLRNLERGPDRLVWRKLRTELDRVREKHSQRNPAGARQPRLPRSKEGTVPPGRDSADWTRLATPHQAFRG